MVEKDAVHLFKLLGSIEAYLDGIENDRCYPAPISVILEITNSDGYARLESVGKSLP